ncbi:MAG: twin-arginine translocase subunit TatC [Dehalococcoidia bacterium]
MRDREAPLREHLAELRRRLLIAVVALIIGTAVAFTQYQRILEVLILPLRRTQGPEYDLVFTEVTEMLAVTIKASLLAGLVLALPVVLYQVIMFVAPGLTSRERRYLLGFLPGVMVAFAGGVAFGYFVLIPPAVGFLISFGGDIATPLIRIGNYVNVVVTLLFWLGVVFETPLVMVMLAKLGIVSAAGFARWRRYTILVAFILGAIITPTMDPVNQALVALPILVLYEVGILLARLLGRRPHAVAPAAGGTEP